MKLLLCLGLFALVLCVVMPWMISPDCRVTQEGRTLRVAPNFIVNGFLTITVSLGEEVVLTIDNKPNYLVGAQVIELPKVVGPGDVVRVTCVLLYDRPMPSARSVEKEVMIR